QTPGGKSMTCCTLRKVLPPGIRLSLVFLLYFSPILFAAEKGTRTGGQDSSQSLTVQPEQFTLHGMHDGRQLLVSRGTSRQEIRDMTHKAEYLVKPSGVIRVTPQGYVHPAGKGTATITVKVGSEVRSVRAQVTDYHENRPLHFGNDIVPLLTRFG